jgi:hypothetical protein
LVCVLVGVKGVEDNKSKHAHSCAVFIALLVTVVFCISHLLRQEQRELWITKWPLSPKAPPVGHVPGLAKLKIDNMFS